jgi:hypothetical protein
MRAKTPTMSKYEMVLTMLRAAKSRDQYKCSIGGREKRRTRPIPSLPKLNSIDNGNKSHGVVGKKGMLDA